MSQSAMREVPIAEAARFLGTSTEAVRKRVQRKSLPGHKRDGQWFVLLPDTQDGHGAASPDDSSGHDRTEASDKLLAELRAEIADLKAKLDRQDQALFLKDQTIAQLVSRLPQLPPARQESGQPSGLVQKIRSWFASTP